MNKVANAPPTQTRNETLLCGDERYRLLGSSSPPLSPPRLGKPLLFPWGKQSTPWAANSRRSWSVQRGLGRCQRWVGRRGAAKICKRRSDWCVIGEKQIKWSKDGVISVRLSYAAGSSAPIWGKKLLRRKWPSWCSWRRDLLARFGLGRALDRDSLWKIVRRRCVLRTKPRTCARRHAHCWSARRSR